MATYSVQLGSYYAETGTTPAQLREKAVGQGPPAMEMIVERAVARGEIDPARLTRRIVTLPSDLFSSDTKRS